MNDTAFWQFVTLVVVLAIFLLLCLALPEIVDLLRDIKECECEGAS